MEHTVDDARYNAVVLWVKTGNTKHQSSRAPPRSMKSTMMGWLLPIPTPTTSYLAASRRGSRLHQPHHAVSLPASSLSVHKHGTGERKQQQHAGGTKATMKTKPSKCLANGRAGKQNNNCTSCSLSSSLPPLAWRQTRTPLLASSLRQTLCRR